MLISTFLLIACSKSDDQKRFEQEALGVPENITETDAAGKVIENRKDPDDWRVSPMYQSLITIGEPYTQLPYPNPIGYNENVNLDIYLGSVGTLSRIEIIALDSLNQSSGLNITRSNLSSPSLINIKIMGSQISGSPGGSQASGLYRLLVYDGRNNLITYGDIRIGQPGTP